MPRLEIKSSAIAHDPYVKVMLFGAPDQGKSMIGCTAPNPVWALFEETRRDSLTRDLVEAAFPVPDDDAIKAWLQTAKGLKGKALEEAFNNFGDVELTAMTGITYDMPRLELFNPGDVEGLIETLNALPHETVILDTASVLSKMLLDHFAATGGKNGGPMLNKMQAYDRAAKKVMEVFRGLYKMKKHVVFVTRGKLFGVNKGSKEEPLFIQFLQPEFQGKDLCRNIPHDISNIFQSLSRIGKTGKREFFLRTRKETVDEWERTSSPHLADEEPANLTALFNKILKK